PCEFACSALPTAGDAGGSTEGFDRRGREFFYFRREFRVRSRAWFPFEREFFGRRRSRAGRRGEAAFDPFCEFHAAPKFRRVGGRKDFIRAFAGAGGIGGHD